MNHISFITYFSFLLLWAFLGYLGGSMPSAYIVAKSFRGVDIRQYGSGNVGATNLGRLMGRKWAVAVTIFDMLKGGIMVLLAIYFGMDDFIVAVTAFCAVLGHNYPLWLDFKGGKGVSTTYGTMFFVCPWLSFMVVPFAGLLWLLLVRFTHYVSVGSILSLLSMSCIFYITGGAMDFVVLSLALAILSIWRHRSNLKRLKEGTESKVFQRDN